MTNDAYEASQKVKAFVGEMNAKTLGQCVIDLRKENGDFRLRVEKLEAVVAQLQQELSSQRQANVAMLMRSGGPTT